MNTVALPTSRSHDRAGSAFPKGRSGRVDAIVRTAAALAMGSGLLLVSWWWAAGGGISDLTGWATGLTSLGRLTGLLAADLMLVQVLLMARVPLLERAVGQDRLARMHRYVGFTSFNLMLAHVGLILWGYAAGSLSAVPSVAWDLTVDNPGMLLAVAGFACLLLVTVTSIRAARSSLRYESWHLLHLYAYLGVGLALPHQLWTGQEFLDRPGATAYWWTLWGLAAGAVLWWRVAVPLYRSWRHRLRVTSVADEGDGTVSVYLGGRALHRLRAQAGQYFTWRFRAGPGWTRGHPYSLSAAPDGRSLRISVKALGDGSAAAPMLRPGTRVLVEGPYGRLSARARTHPQSRLLLIGAGVGLTPLRALAEELEYAPGEALLIARHHGHLLFRRELEVLADERGLQVYDLPGPRRSAGSFLPATAGTADDATTLLHWVPDLADRDVYVCGPEPWAALVRQALLTAGLPPEQFHHESFSW